MTFSELIKSRRQELGLTQVDVARAVGVKKSTILRWERGEINNPRRDRIARLALILQLPPMALVSETFGPPEYTGEQVQEMFGVRVPEEKPQPLTDSEQELVDLYRRLSDAGQGQLTSYARFLSAGPEGRQP